MSSYLCKRPTAGTAAGLAAKLKWLLQTVGVGLLFLRAGGRPVGNPVLYMAERFRCRRSMAPPWLP